MPTVGDGTGTGTKPTEVDGLTWVEGKTPEKPGGDYGQGQSGKGPQKYPYGNRNTPLNPTK